jgi:hypothetical protein
MTDVVKYYALIPTDDQYNKIMTLCDLGIENFDTSPGNVLYFRRSRHLGYVFEWDPPKYYHTGFSSSRNIKIRVDLHGFLEAINRELNCQKRLEDLFPEIYVTNSRITKLTNMSFTVAEISEEELKVLKRHVPNVRWFLVPPGFDGYERGTKLCIYWMNPAIKGEMGWASRETCVSCGCEPENILSLDVFLGLNHFHNIYNDRIRKLESKLTSTKNKNKRRALQMKINKIRRQNGWS